MFRRGGAWGDVGGRQFSSAPEILCEKSPGSLSRRVSLRASLRWHRTKIDANRRKPTKQDENVKWLVPRGLREKGPSPLGFLEMREKNPCLPANTSDWNNQSPSNY